MAIISPLPNTLTNGTTADATLVMADFNQIVANVNANAVAKTDTLIPPEVQLQFGTNSITSDVPLNNVANYFTGPTVPNSGLGVWFVSGTVTLKDTGASAGFFVKLWDGTTVIASTTVTSLAATATVSVSLSGVLALPTGSFRISVRDATAATGVIVANVDGLGNFASTLTAVRIE